MRALYHDPEVIIFDEATSALDNKSEEYIINIMTKLKQQGKTIIAISHRVGTAQIADRTILLEKGQIIADGKHSELIAKSDAYKEFWE